MTLLEFVSLEQGDIVKTRDGYRFVHHIDKDNDLIFTCIDPYQFLNHSFTKYPFNECDKF